MAVALTVPKDDRAQLGDSWVAGGLVAFDAANAASLTSNLDSSWSVIPIAIGPTRAARDTIEGWRQGRVVRSSVDPVHEYIQDVLSCPRLALQTGRTSAQLAKLDSLCNLR